MTSVDPGSRSVCRLGRTLALERTIATEGMFAFAESRFGFIANPASLRNPIRIQQIEYALKRTVDVVLHGGKEEGIPRDVTPTGLPGPFVTSSPYLGGDFPGRRLRRSGRRGVGLRLLGPGMPEPLSLIHI